MEIKKIEKKEKNTVVLEIAVGAEEFKEALEQAYRKNVKKLNVPGFRKGKAPRKMIEKMYGEGVFYDDAVNATYAEAYADAVSQSGIDPVDNPDIDITEISDEGYVFTANVTVKPEVKVGQYRGIEAVKREADVSDLELDSEIERMRTRVASVKKAERPSEEGDTVLIDYEGFVDGVPFEGGKAEKYNLTLGSHQFIPGFEDQLIGKSAGECCDVNVTFPEEYHAEDLAGKPAVFKCFIHEVNETIKPELNDEFAKDVSEFDTLDELKADVRAKLLESKQRSMDNMFEESLIDRIIDGMEADVPQVMYDRQIDKLVDEFARRLSMQGLGIETYLQMNEMDMESFRKLFEDQAERQVKISLALEEIVRLENIVPSDEEIESEYKSMSERYSIEVDKIKEMVSADALKDDIATRKAVDMIKESAVVVAGASEEV